MKTSVDCKLQYQITAVYFVQSKIQQIMVAI